MKIILTLLFFCSTLVGQIADVRYMGTPQPHLHQFEISSHIIANESLDSIVVNLNWVTHYEAIKDNNLRRNEFASVFKKAVKLESFKVFYQGKSIDWEYADASGAKIIIDVKLKSQDTLALSYQVLLSEQERNLNGGVIGPYAFLEDLLCNINGQAFDRVNFDKKAYLPNDYIVFRKTEKVISLAFNHSNVDLKIYCQKKKWEEKIIAKNLGEYLKTLPSSQDVKQINIWMGSLSLTRPRQESLAYYTVFRKEVGLVHISDPEMLKLVIAEAYFLQLFPEDTILAQAKAFAHFQKHCNSDRLLNNWHRVSSFFWIQNSWEKSEWKWSELNDVERFQMRPLLGDVWMLDSTRILNHSPFEKLNEHKSYAPIATRQFQKTKMPLRAYGSSYKIRHGWSYDSNENKNKIQFLSLYEHAPVMYSPSYNLYDGFGLYLTASADEMVLGRNSLSYFLSPGYGFKSKAFIYEAFARLKSYGLGDKVLVWQNAFRSRKHYQLNGVAGKAWYNTHQLYSDVLWKLDTKKSWTLQTGLTMGYVQEGGQLVVETDSTINSLNVNESRWNWESRNVLQYQKGLSRWRLTMVYKGLNQDESWMHNLDFETSFKRIYTRDNKGVEIGVKWGYFIQNTFFNSRYNYNYFADGGVDYNYEMSSLGRTENQGFTAAQVNQESWFKSRSVGDVSGSWYGLARIKVDMPKGIPLQVYNVIGLLPITVINGNTGVSAQRIVSVYELGISIIALKGAVKIHVPLYNFRSLNSSSNPVTIGDRVSFELNLFQLIKKDRRLHY